MNDDGKRWESIADAYANTITENDIRAQALYEPLYRCMYRDLCCDTGVVLDYGCGSGEFVHLLGQRNAAMRIVGTDIAATFLRIASARYQLPNIAFKPIDEVVSPCKYTIITCILVLHVCESYEQVVRHIYSLLSDEGSAYIVIMHPRHWKYDVAMAQTATGVHHFPVLVDSRVEIEYYYRDEHAYENVFISTGFSIRQKVELCAHAHTTNDMEIDPKLQRFLRAPIFLLYHLRRPPSSS